MEKEITKTAKKTDLMSLTLRMVNFFRKEIIKTEKETVFGSGTLRELTIRLWTMCGMLG